MRCRSKWLLKSVNKEAAQKAKPVLLEPIMKLEVVTPEDFMGDIIADLNRRRGQVESMVPVSGPA